MKGGRKNLKMAVEQKSLNLENGHNIMQVLSLRGSNLIEVRDTKGNTLLALFPARFQKSMWIKQGSFVVVDESGKEEALESGNKVGCIVSQVLFHNQVRVLQNSPEWPEVFKSKVTIDSGGDPKTGTSQQDDCELESSGSDDELPPLEANTNRYRPHDVHEDEDSDSELD